MLHYGVACCSGRENAGRKEIWDCVIRLHDAKYTNRGVWGSNAPPSYSWMRCDEDLDGFISKMAT